MAWIWSEYSTPCCNKFGVLQGSVLTIDSLEWITEIPWCSVSFIRWRHTDLHIMDTWQHNHMQKKLPKSAYRSRSHLDVSKLHEIKFIKDWLRQGTSYPQSMQLGPSVLAGVLSIHLEPSKLINFTLSVICLWKKLVNDVCVKSYASLRNIAKIRHSLYLCKLVKHSQTLVQAFITFRLDSCNEMLFVATRHLVLKLRTFKQCCTRVVK